jgi:sugar phosphate isomerase/epimerase
MQLGIFAKTFDGKSPSEVLHKVKAAGFGTAQYNMACSGLSALPDSISDQQVSDIRTAVATSGVTLNAMSATYNMIHPHRQVREDGHHRLEVAAAAAQALGIPVITLCTGTRDAEDQWRHHADNNSLEAWRDLLQSMHTAIGIADRYNVNLGIEPELANVVNSAAKAKALIAECGSPRLKIVFDPANLFETETVSEQRRIIASALDVLSGHIAMAHAKDRTADGRFVAAGTGVMDYPNFLNLLKQSGFDGPMVTHGLNATEAPDVAAFLKREIQHLERTA